ncbi:hypothetical protein KKD61_03695 [Patescibacteria group bacterium]|nr:hypothetical protein [Patescibacteria group bacterium]
MLSDRQVELICKSYLPRYQNVKLEILLEIAQSAAKEARESYEKLPVPRTCDLTTYTRYCVNGAIVSDVKLNVKPINSDKPQKNSFNRAVADYFNIIPLESFDRLWTQIYKRNQTETEAQILKDLKPLFNKLKSKYVNLTKGRNQEAEKRGYKSQLELILEIHQIPQEDYQVFLKNKDKVIEYCQSQIPRVELPDWFYSQFNSQCYLCKLPEFPKLKYPDEIFEFVAKEYPILKKFRHKIRFAESSSSTFRYVKESDSFLISIAKKHNSRHRLTALIHELGHTVAALQNFKKGIDPLTNGRYPSEIDAFKIESNLFKKLSAQVYQAEVAGTLSTLYEIIFQIEAYRNPDQNLPVLYGKIFKHCFPKAKLKENYTYLINEDIVALSLRTLPHAITQVKILSSQR